MRLALFPDLMARPLTILAGLAFFALGGMARLSAMTVEAMDLNRLLRDAPEIYKAQVMSVTCDWSGVSTNRHIATFVRLRVLESYRGAVEGEQVLEFFGGTIGDRTQRIVGMPQFQPGDIDILFVRGNHTDICPLAGIFHGRLRVVTNAADGREQVFLHDGSPLTNMSLIGTEPGARPKPAATDLRGEPTRALTTTEFGVEIRAGLKQRGIAADEP